jgi:NAD(P)-dependent dehydrogenase (short-subunit alcohol dehydrogenase family)
MAISVALDDKVAIVTGGGRGIGKAIAASLAQAGAKVVIASRKLDNLVAAAEEIGPNVTPIQCHVGRPAERDELVERTERDVGPVDILVNNSATNLGQGPSLETDAAQFDKIFEINVKSAYHLVHKVVPGMRARGGGSIINLASISGLKPQAGGLLYSFTKAGLVMMTRSWAREFGPWNIRVNGIAPGLIKTDFSTYFWADDERRETLVGDQPLQRLGVPEDIGFAAVYLASDLSSFMTGHTLVIDGGALA